MGPMTTRQFFQSQTKTVHRTYSRGADETPVDFTRLFNDYENDMKRSFMTFIPYIGLGTFQLRTEGSPPVVDSASEGTPTTVNFASYSLGYTITKEASIEDAMNALAELPHYLAYSSQVTQDYLIWNIWNLSANAGVTLWDGQPLQSATHKLEGPQGGTWSNTGSTTALSVEALQAADIALLTLTNDRGLPAKVNPVNLVIGPQLAQTAEEINASNLYPYTADNRVNVQAQKKTIINSRYITSNTQWGVTGAKGRVGMNSHSMFYSFKWKDEQDSFYEDKTKTFSHTSDMRLAFDTIDGRGVYISTGS
jgi:Mu-like prophage major head subunit gpT